MTRKQKSQCHESNKKPKLGTERESVCVCVCDRERRERERHIKEHSLFVFFNCRKVKLNHNKLFFLNTNF